MTAWPAGTEGCWVPVVHAVCPHNEIAALCLRVLGPLPPQVFGELGADVRRVFSRLRRLSSATPVERWSLERTALSYQGALRRRYLDAAASLALERVSAADARLSCFLKAEKVNVGPKYPKPRMIFPRSPRYNLCLASRLKPFEHWLWGRLTASSLRLRGGVGRLVAKGLNPWQRARLIVRKFNNLPGCTVFEVDGKAWEAHTGPALLKGEHGVYRAAFPGDSGLAALLVQQLVLAGRLPCGARFSRSGGRASGDFNTGMGNSLGMLAVLLGALESLAPSSYDVLVDGDNALVFLPGSDYQGVVGAIAPHVLASSGHELTLESPCRVIEEIRFGRSAPVDTGSGWCMVRDYRSVLSAATSSHRWLREPTFAREWLAGVAMCELSLALGVPVLQAWALELLNSVDFVGDVRAHPHVDYFILGARFAKASEARPVVGRARQSFERAFGLSPEAQIRLESSLRYRGGPFRELEPFVDLDSAPPGVLDAWLSSVI